MDAYIEVTLQPDDEFPQHLLMDALIAKLHRALVAADEGGIGLSFPGWQDGDYPTLGGKVRLHGTAASLESLMGGDWMRGLRDHMQFQGPQPIPAHYRYWLVRRVKAKSAANMRKRAMRRHGLTEAEALKRIPDSAGDVLSLPFTTQRSASTGQCYRLFVRQDEGAGPGVGGFSRHGLSMGTAVPAF